MLAYRSKFRVGDVAITKEIRTFLPKTVTYDSVLKNVQRLRKGDRVTGAAFLNACVQFLEVNMVTPPEEELGLAMKHFAGSGLLSYDSFIRDLVGNYALRVLGENRPSHYEPVSLGALTAKGFVSTIPVTPQPVFGDRNVTLSINRGEGKEYGVASETYAFPAEAEDENAEPSFVNRLQLKGLCLPIGQQNILILMRDFLLSHVYVLQRDEQGFTGTLILPSPHELFHADIPSGVSRPQYDVKLERLSEA